MNKLLPIYREAPPSVPLRGREHAPVCRWCYWRRGLLERCHEPHNNPSGDDFHGMTKVHNENLKCDRYLPSRWTRLLQWLKIRPFVER